MSRSSTWAAAARSTTTTSSIIAAASAGWPEHKGVGMQAFFDVRETQPADGRERDLFARLPDFLRAAARSAPAVARQLQGFDPAGLSDRAGLARVPVLRKSELLQIQHEARLAHAGAGERDRVFGGFSALGWDRARRVFASPGPIYEPEGPQPDYWGFARA